MESASQEAQAAAEAAASSKAAPKPAQRRRRHELAEQEVAALGGIWNLCAREGCNFCAADNSITRGYCCAMCEKAANGGSLEQWCA